MISRTASHFEPHRPEKPTISRTASHFEPPRPEKPLISRTASHFEPPRPEKPTISRTASHFEPPCPEKPTISRTASHFKPPRPEKTLISRTASHFEPPRPKKPATASRRGEPLGELPAADLRCSCRKSYTPTAVLTDRFKIRQTRRVFQRVFVIRELCETYHLRQIRLPEVPLRWSRRLDPKGRPPNERYL